MGVTANLMLPLGDAISSVETFVNVFFILYGLILIAYIILSWIQLPYSIWLNRIQRFLYDVCAPYLAIFRRLIPMAGPIDFSPILAFVALGVFNRLIIWILNHFH